jgi:HEAT repeat protein
MMKRTSTISGTGNMPGQVDTTPRESSSVSIIMLLVLGASFFVLGALTIVLYRLYIATGEYGLLAYVLGMLATAVFLWLSALLASRFSKKKAVPTYPKVRDALISTLQQDPDPRVRSAAAEGLAELDLEESTEYLEHKNLDAILISTLQQDPDPRVRSAAAEGLAELELEQSSYHHEHNELEDILFKHGQ